MDVVGEEAHIVARSVRGPRGDSSRSIDINGYDNLVLLCPNDHQRVDQDPERYTTDVLRTIKRAHERWSVTHYDVSAHASPSLPSGMVEIHEASSGGAIWDAVAHAEAYYLESEVPDHDRERRRTGANFLQAARDYGEVSGEIRTAGPSAVQDAVEALTQELEIIRSERLSVWVGLTTAAIGPAQDPLRVPAAVVVVRRERAMD